MSRPSIRWIGSVPTGRYKWPRMKSHRTQLSKLGMWSGGENTWRCNRCGVQVHRRGKLCDHERWPKKLSLRKYARCFCARIWTACGEHNAKNIKAMHAPILIGRNVSGCDCHYVRTSESQVELTHLIFVWLLLIYITYAGVCVWTCINKRVCWEAGEKCTKC